MSLYTHFDPEIELSKNENGLFIASRSLYWEVGRKGSNLWIEVPKDYANDGPSIPKAFTLFFSRSNPKYQKAARLHDWLCDQQWTTRAAFSIFGDALKADQASVYERWVMSLSVLLFKSIKDRQKEYYK